MTTATHLLYRAAGEPGVANAELTEGLCWLCGEPIHRGVPREMLLRDTFMDYDKCAVPWATHLCHACGWSFSEQIPMPGRDKAQRLRNYSHIVQGGTWHCLSKGQKREMQNLLLNPPSDEWLAVIAVSGQKHIVFRAPVAYGNVLCAIQFEEQRLTYGPLALGTVLNAIQSLMDLGFSKGEIEIGQYHQPRVLKAGFETWTKAENTIRSNRGSLLFQLALFLAQKETKDE